MKLNTTHTLNKLASGEPVIDRHNSHLANDAVTLAAVNAALARTRSHNRPFIEEEVEFAHPVGETSCVTTTSDDVVVYAPRIGRNGLTRFVLDRRPEACNKVYVVLKRIEGGQYLLITAFVGKRAQPEPFDEKAFSHARDRSQARRDAEIFWSQHALLFDPTKIVRNA